MAGRKPIGPELLKKRQLQAEKLARRKEKNAIKKDENSKKKEIHDKRNKLIRDVRRAADKNAVTEARLNKLKIPAELHEAVRITAEKIYGKRIVFLADASKKVGTVIKGGFIIITGVAAIQIPRILEEIKHDQLVARRTLDSIGLKEQEINMTELVKNTLKEYDVAIGVPNVLSKESLQNYAKTEGVAFGGGALLATVSIVILSMSLKRFVNNSRAKKALKKTGQL